MAKTKTKFICQQCGHNSIKWLGKCPDCGEWNSMVEEIIENDIQHSVKPITNEKNPPLSINEIELTFENHYKTEIHELDRVLGGGLVQGALILVGGDPGIGKSTLLIYAMEKISQSGKTVLYISGEESPSQIKLRAQRLNITSNNLKILSETSLESILGWINTLKPFAVVIDSIQTIYSQQSASPPGSVSQIREVTASMMKIAKLENISTFIVGHVTKDGAIAGPKLLEHLVDTVLYFEGDGNYSYRILRAHKNRFGSTNEIGVFEMSSSGLKEVSNPSQLFISERAVGESGSIVVSTISGTRPILVEMQSLVSISEFPSPRRTGIGYDNNRISLLAAVLDKILGLSIGNHDIFVNVPGGIKLDEPAVDLGAVIAMSSSHRKWSIKNNVVAFGEVGLAGEVRRVIQAERRISEAEKLGFTTCIIPAGNVEEIKNSKINLIPVKNVGEVLNCIQDLS